MLEKDLNYSQSNASTADDMGEMIWVKQLYNIRVMLISFFMQWNNYCFGQLLREYTLIEEYTKDILQIWNDHWFCHFLPKYNPDPLIS